MTNVPTAWFPARLLCEMSKTSSLYSNTCHGYSATWLVEASLMLLLLSLLHVPKGQEADNENDSSPDFSK